MTKFLPLGAMVTVFLQLMTKFLLKLTTLLFRRIL
jgi:hypothetical protein